MQNTWRNALSSLVRSCALSLFALQIMGWPVAAGAEPCLLAYPQGQVVFRYDPLEYETLGPASPNYSDSYQVGGQVLWNRMEKRVAFEVYQAPALTGFEPSPTGRNEFCVVGSRHTLTIDGFSAVPRQFANIQVQFRPLPLSSDTDIKVNGSTKMRINVGFGTPGRNQNILVLANHNSYLAKLY